MVYGERAVMGVPRGCPDSKNLLYPAVAASLRASAVSELVVRGVTRGVTNSARKWSQTGAGNGSDIDLSH